MNHVRYPRAAVAVAAPGSSTTTPRNPERLSSNPPTVLWASVPWYARDGGRVVAVRCTHSSEVQVAWVGPEKGALQWRPASDVLSDAEAQRWLQRAHFTKA